MVQHLRPQPFWDVTPLKTEEGGKKTPPQHSGTLEGNGIMPTEHSVFLRI